MNFPFLVISDYFLRKGANAKQSEIAFPTLMQVAVIRDHVALIPVLAEAGADLEETKFFEPFDNPPLLLAMQPGRALPYYMLYAVMALLNAGANVNARGPKGVTALMVAASEGLGNVVDYLVKHGAKVNLKNSDALAALHFAAWNGHAHIVSVLLANGAIADDPYYNSNAPSPLMAAAFRGHRDAILHLVSIGGSDVNRANQAGMNPLMVAAYSGERNIISYLVESGADVNEADSEDTTVLMHAAFGSLKGFVTEDDNVEVVTLEEVGSERFKQLLWERVEDGFKPKEEKDTVAYLIESGANVTAMDASGRSALTIAAELGHVNIVKLLLETNASNVGHRDVSGRNALTLAAVGGHGSIVKLLAGAGSESDLCYSDGDTDLPHLALSYGHPEVLRLLLWDLNYNSVC